MPTKRRMKISELEKATGVPRTTIHYYIREGLLHRPEKTGRTMCFYDETHAQRLATIRSLQENYLAARKKSYMPIPDLMAQLEEFESDLKSGNSAYPSNRRNRADRKKELINAAQRLLQRKGFRSVSIREIAREAGISTSAFYTYYSDKRELFAEITEVVLKQMKKEFGVVMRSEKEPGKRLGRMIRIFHQNYSNFAEALSILRKDFDMGDMWSRNRLNTIYKYMADIAYTEIKRYIKQGKIRNIDPELLSFLLVGMIEGAIQLERIYEKYTFEQIILFSIDTLFCGLMPQTDNRPPFDPANFKKLLTSMDS